MPQPTRVSLSCPASQRTSALLVEPTYRQKAGQAPPSGHLDSPVLVFLAGTFAALEFDTVTARTAWPREEGSAAMREMFRRSGEVGRHLLDVDWAATPLGDPDTWPRSLQEKGVHP